jgi:hypothetical protein
MTTERGGWRVWWTSAFAGLAVLVGGCGGEEASRPQTARRVIEVAELPPTVIGAAKKQLPQINFDEAWTNVGETGGIVSYEVRGRGPNGKIREVRVSPEGQILEME